MDASTLSLWRFDETAGTLTGDETGRRFDTARISTLKSRLLSRRFGQGAADAARLALGAALTALTGAGALGMMGAKEAGLGEKSYAAKGILGEADAQYLADYLSLAAKLERKSGEFSARNRAYVAELERAAALLADEKQRRALEAERQRELDRARRLLGRSDGGTD